MVIDGLIKVFGIYPHHIKKTDKYYEVFIFNSHDSMYNYYNSTGGYEKCDFNAICRDLEIYKGNIPLNKIGEVLIPIEKCNINIITHECGHAIFQYIRKISKIDTLNCVNNNYYWKDEEMYCELLGEIISQFIHMMYILDSKEILL